MSDYSFSEHEIEAAFYDFVASLGYEPDYKGWKSDGERRTARLKSSADKGHESSAKARLYVDKPANGWIYDYRRDEYIRWNYRDTIQGDHAKLEAYQAALPTPEEQAVKKAAREQYEQWERGEAVRKAREQFALARPFDGTHEYLKRKGVKAYEGIKKDRYGNIVIPIYKLPDMVNIINYQRIAPDGGKYFAPDCSIAGAVYIIGKPKPDEPLGLVEGYATAASVHEATGIPIAVCFNCHNLTKAAANIKAYLKASDYFVFADNDRGNEVRADLRKNHGMEAAREAARALGVDAAHIIAPEAPEGENVDWNDRDALLSCEPDVLRRELADKIAYAGLTEEKRQGRADLDTLRPTTLELLHSLKEDRGRGLNLGWSFFDGNGAEIQLICQALTLIGARTSGGKTLTLANIAARVVLTRPDAHVLFLTLEEAHESVFYRILSAYLAQAGYVSEAVDIKAIERAIDTDGYSLGVPDSPHGRDAWDAITAGIKALGSRLLIADLIALPEAEKAGRAAALIEAFVDRYGAENSVICLDYIQLLRPDKPGSGDYRDFKKVMDIIKGLTRKKIAIFAGAQFNREAAKGTKDAANDPEAEFRNTYAEQLREAGDLEQGAEIVLYCRADKEGRFMNYRVLKNRRGQRETTMSMPVDFSRGFLDWSDQAPDSFSGRGAGINYSAMLDNDRKKQARKKRVDGRL